MCRYPGGRGAGRLTGVSVMPEFHVFTFDTAMLEDTKQ